MSQWWTEKPMVKTIEPERVAEMQADIARIVMEREIIEAHAYYPGAVCNMLYMGSIARFELYRMLGGSTAYPLTPLADVLKAATLAQVEAAHIYVQPYLAAARGKG